MKVISRANEGENGELKLLIEIIGQFSVNPAAANNRLEFVGSIMQSV